jgi:hypothetical protein
MRFPWLILCFILLPFISLAQNGVISGVITGAESKKPLPRASVFLSNSGVGSATGEDGRFTLSGVRPGQYTLVVTILGYEQYTKTILVSSEPIHLDIEMTPKPLMLREVVISSAADWKKNYEQFRKEFIGSDDNAKYCTVLNPHILNLTYNPTKQLLHADADQFLIVENKALGYRVKFLLNDFKIDKIANLISREGQQVFEELPGSEAQKKRWHQKREEAYYGSAMHFYRSLYTDKLKQEGFEIYRFSRYLNPERPPDDVIRKKLQIFKDHRMIDSAKRLVELANMSKYYHENLMKPPLNTFEVLNGTEQKGIYALHFVNYLYIVYTRKTDDVYNRDLYRPLDMPNYAISVVTPTGPFILFDMNGVVIQDAPIYEGSWSQSRLSDMLPVDYVPDRKSE